MWVYRTHWIKNSTKHNHYMLECFTWWHKTSTRGILSYNIRYLHSNSFHICKYFRNFQKIMGSHTVLQKYFIFDLSFYIFPPSSMKSSYSSSPLSFYNTTLHFSFLSGSCPLLGPLLFFKKKFLTF